jgi:hypothetical protein
MEVGDLVQIQQNRDPFEQLAVVVSLDRSTDNSIYAVKVFKMDGRMLWVRPKNIWKVYPNV